MKLKLQLLILSLVTAVVVAMTFLIYHLAYPLKYENMIISASLEFSIQPELIAAVINSESSFDKNATSNKGAEGLMQLMPTTANMLAAQLGMENVDLFDPETNIKLGSFYLSQLFARFDNFEVAICAYNAGPGRVSSWLKDERYSNDGKTLSNIPFSETATYLEKVVKNAKIYQNRFN